MAYNVLLFQLKIATPFVGGIIVSYAFARFGTRACQHIWMVNAEKTSFFIEQESMCLKIR